LVAFDNLQDELGELGVQVVAASVDMGDASREVAEEVSFKIGEGVTRDQADILGAWYGDARHPEMIQPSEFLVNPGGKVLMSSYSAGPLGRMNPDDLIKVINFLESLPK
jgi:alkyl hydroperoxide reductase subunit AhpC